jgi:F-type H+-transporting ATPase subunit gamma
MASINELKKKIRGVKSTRQITKAMKMIAGMRLSRSQKKFKDSLYYLDKTSSILPPLLADPDLDPNSAGRLLKTALAKTESGRSLYIVISGDRGLCGSFNNSALTKAGKTVAQDKETLSVFLVGRKASDRAKTFKMERIERYPDFFGTFDFPRAGEITDKLLSYVENENVSRVYVVHNTFVSLISFKTKVTRLLPIDRETLAKDEKKDTFEYEPGVDSLCEHAIRQYLRAAVYKLLAESYYSELAARISAMDNATRNANELIDELTLEMNKVRQSNITKELADIVGGAESMR